jgi:hypothetical protein
MTRRAFALLLVTGTARAEMLEHPDDVVDYTLAASLDPSTHVIHGEGTIVWRNKSATPISELWVHLYLNAFKDEKSVFLSEPVGQFRGSGLPKDWGRIDVKRFVWNGADLWPGAELHRPGESDETDVRVPLPRPVLPGELVPIEVAFESKLPTIVMRTGYDGTFHMVGQWFPKIARLEPDGTFAHFPFHRLAEFYADYGTYDVTLDVPESFIIGATGPIVDQRIEHGRRIERHVQSDVHDFAWAAWDKFESRSESIAGVTVTSLFPRGYRVDSERELGAMRFALPHYAAQYGPYPYSVLTLVHPPESAPEAGGMEYPTLITTGGPWYGPPGIMAIEAVTIHEFGHQYFYGLLASNEALWPFLDEGLNSFAEQQALDAWLGDGSAVDLFGLKVSNTAVQRFFSRGRVHDAPVAQPAWSFATGRDYGGLVYGRTAMIFETLRRVYGDRQVMRAIGRYAREQRFRHPAPEDLLAPIGEDLGEDVEQTLRTALFGRGWIDFSIEEISNRKAGDHNEGWVLVMRKGTLSLPVEIEITYENGRRERRTWDGRDRWVRLFYRGDSRATFAVVDPGHKVLIDEDDDNNHASAPDQSGDTRRSLERATYWGELLATLLCP